ncbi:MAG: protein-L-isoaspartate(D-aspartate) O-methyltransferase [Candidatus Hodarchaeales archaeon]
MRDLQKDKNRLIRMYKDRGLVKDEIAFKAFSEVPRELFLPEKHSSSAYLDHPLPLMNTGQTISAPHMTIMILEYLELESNLKVLEIGAGSGYQASLIAAAISSNSHTTGHVFSIEIVPELVNFAKNNIKMANYDHIVTVLEGDGTQGYQEESPYDRIILTAAGPKLPPPLIDQLKIGGILVMPLGKPRSYQVMTRFKKLSESEISKEELSSVAFVPLRGEYGT